MLRSSAMAGAAGPSDVTRTGGATVGGRILPALCISAKVSSSGGADGAILTLRSKRGDNLRHHNAAAAAAAHSKATPNSPQPPAPKRPGSGVGAMATTMID